MGFLRPAAALAVLLAFPIGSAFAENIALRFHYNEARGVTSFTPLHAETGTFAVTPNARDGKDEAQWKVVARDAQGKVLHEVAVRNGLERHIEQFDPKSGTIKEARKVKETAGVFEVSLPYDADTASVEVLAPSAGGQARAASVASPLAKFNRSALDSVISRSKQERLQRTAVTAAAAAPVATSIINTGPSSARMDYVFIGDGYTAAEMAKWRTDAQRVIDGMMADPLFAANRNSMNVRRVDIASNQSGVDEIDKGIYKDTALGANFGCFQMERLLCVDEAKTLSTVASVLSPDQRDVIVVVANSTRYGGAGGAVATLSMHASAVELALHEIGHTAFALADEYDNGTCSLSQEPSEVNVSRVGTRSVKWGAHIAASTAVPTAPGVYANGTVGAFAGAQYCTSGKYRPTENSRMRTLGSPWHVVNENAVRAVMGQYTAMTQTGSLANGGSAYVPSAAPGYVDAGAGTFSLSLTGPGGTDFDLFLYKWNGSAWAKVASSEGSSSTESISYNGTAGYYYGMVKSYSGAGSYTVKYSFPPK
jgi:hypothetical protein